MVTPETPVNVVKKVVTITAATTAPPRNQPNVDLQISTRRFPAVPCDKIYPAIVNSGIAAILLSVQIRYASFASISTYPPPCENAIYATPLIAIKRGTSIEDATTEYEYQKNSIGSIAFEGWASYLNLDGKSISEEVKNSIENIASIQTYAKELKGKNIKEIDYNSVESRCKEEMENIAGILEKDYVVEQNVLKTKEIKKLQTRNETAKTDREDDEMEL